MKDIFEQKAKEMEGNMYFIPSFRHGSTGYVVPTGEVKNFKLKANRVGVTGEPLGTIVWLNIEAIRSAERRTLKPSFVNCKECESPHPKHTVKDGLCIHCRKSYAARAKKSALPSFMKS